MKVIFKSVDIEGFLSVGHSVVDLEKQGMVYVTGENRSPGNQDSNGSGKSTIFEAIIYTLTGSTLRGTRDVVNKYYSKGYCSITLKLEVDGVEYAITRTREHPEYGNNLIVIRDGEDISGGKLRRSETILEQELGQLTSNLISGIIILGQGLPNKFTDLGPKDRKARLEELSQSSEFIDEIKVRITNFGNSYNDTLGNVKIEEARNDATVSMDKNNLKSMGEEYRELTSQTVDLTQIDEEIKVLSSKLSEFKKAASDIDGNREKLKNTLSDYRVKISNLEMDISQNDRTAKKLSDDLGKIHESKCPTCGQFIQSPDKVKEMKDSITEQVNTLNEKNAEYREQINELEKSRDMLSGKCSEFDKRFDDINSKYLMVNSKIVELKMQKSNTSDRLEKLKTNILECRDDLEKATSELNRLRNDIKELELKIGVIKYLEKIVSKDFRNYLLTGVVEYLNGKLREYSKTLFGTESLKLTMTDTQIFIQYEDRNYENLSGGERQRADLAMQFSLRDMLMNTLGFQCNLLVIDEGFDNLDTSGVDSLINVINSMGYIDSVFTISHHTLSIPFDKTLMVNKGIDRVSYVEEVI